MSVVSGASRFGSRFLRKRSNQAKSRWKRGLQKRGAGVYVLGAAITLPLLAQFAFWQGTWFGVSFLWAGVAAVVNGYIFRHQLLLLFVYLGVFFSHNVLPLLLRDTWGGILRREWVPALALGLLGLALWLWSRDLQTGAMFTKPKGRSSKAKRGRKATARR